MEKIAKQEVIDLVKNFLSEAEKEIRSDERKEQRKYAALVKNEDDKVMLTRMLDESSQIRNNRKLARRMKFLLDRYGIPRFFNRTDSLLMWLFAKFGYLFHFVAMPIFRKKLREDTSKVIINEKPTVFHTHLKSRKSEEIGQNVNILGEVVLGDKEADDRYYHYLEALKNPQINYISIKISGIYAQITPLNYERNKQELINRLSAIFRKAIKFRQADDKGVLLAKFVNLDMEEYKDTRLTLDVFKATLNLPEFKKHSAGIVVQTYLPDAWDFQTELLEFAHNRVQQGGAPLKMRLVKGANLAMETVISSLKGWENPIYDNKIDVDANYLKLLDRALMPENAAVMHIGVASHNLFTIAYAHLLAFRNGVEDYLSFEMLEGMANYLPRVLKSINRQIILYTPVVSDKNFLNAVAYLVRRLDENTGKDNFLSYSFDLQFGSEAWDILKHQFECAYDRKDTVSTVPKRSQNRQIPVAVITEMNVFANEPDTNFDLISNKNWAVEIRKRWKKKQSDAVYEIPVQVGMQFIKTAVSRKYPDHNQQDEVDVCAVHMAEMSHMKEIIQIAENDPSGWSSLPFAHIKSILHQTAVNLANKRGDLIGCMSAITGKTFYEGDVEVSEAIDFCRYYPLSLEPFASLELVKLSAKGVVLVIPPWNFPTAIPIGGVAAALSAGNRVILKPATVAFPIAWEFVQCFWDAGVPKEALQLVCPDGREPLNFLISHPSIKHIIFTGGTDTALKIMEKNPVCPISAETGGKNAMILTSSCDRDHAIQNILTSAFSNAGQKCSACSLLILEKDIYHDPAFREKLKDAVLSLHAGSAWDAANFVGPMVTNKHDKLLQAFQLEAGEEWLVAPEFADEKQYVLKPTVKWGVKAGSYTFTTELFAPLLAVVCMDTLEHGIRLANSSEYGLTAGLQSLDEREHADWIDKIQAGNLYINRGITGAIVSRQPFGGMKRSAFGAGIKAGGPNYAFSFVEVEELLQELPAVITCELNKWVDEKFIEFHEAPRLCKALHSYRHAFEAVFSLEKDIHNVHGERNILRYLPLQKMVLRIYPGDKLTDVLLVLMAAVTVNVSLTVSCASKPSFWDKLKTIYPDIRFIIEEERYFTDNITRYERIRTCNADIPLELYCKGASTGIYIAHAKPVVEGRIELLHYLREQSISYEYHRYGNIIES
jgi:RHH-type transcriptional regulator, proline utilization regulon repressor / proline dehydrogenase / delta 1-pyrroline-5-carboxylate dehydrogenase